jgi:hypothetical protein
VSDLPEDIHRVLKRVRVAYDKAIGDEVRVFLDHYLSLLGTRFMNDEKIDELRRAIYRNHRQALDLIWARAGTPTSGVLAEVRTVLEEDHRWELDARPSCILCLPKAWLEWLPNFGSRGDPRWWIYVLIGLRDGKLDFGLDMAPMKDVEKGAEIIKKLIEEGPGFVFTRPRSHAKEMKNNYCRIVATERLFDWPEDDEPDGETIRKVVKEKFDALYPKLEKLALVLKRL